MWTKFAISFLGSAKGPGTCSNRNLGQGFMFEGCLKVYFGIETRLTSSEGDWP